MAADILRRDNPNRRPLLVSVSRPTSKIRRGSLLRRARKETTELLNPTSPQNDALFCKQLSFVAYEYQVNTKVEAYH